MEPNERERGIALRTVGRGGAVIDADGLAEVLARYRAELTSDEAVLRRADELVKAAGIRVLDRGCGPGRLKAGEEWSFEAAYVGASRLVGKGATLAEAVAALKGG